MKKRGAGGGGGGAGPDGTSLLATYTVNATKVDETGDFTLSLKDSDFDANVYSNCDNGGGDLRFTSDLAGTTRLPCDVVSFNTATSKSEVHVKATLDSSSDTVNLYLGK